MKSRQTLARTALLLAVSTGLIAADPLPYVHGRFQGRIAWSCDGNHNDPDDWAASPVALAILAEMGLKDRLVHFDYNSILPLTDPEFEREHSESVLGAADRYGFDKFRFHDCRRDLEAVLASIAKAVEESTAVDPLYFVIAGPMEVPLLGLRRADPSRRRFVFCISHSRWNDGFAPNYSFTQTKRSVIALGVNWTRIRDQNGLLSLTPYGRPAKAEEYAGFFWMRDSSHAIPDVAIRAGDELRVEVTGAKARLDFVQLSLEGDRFVGREESYFPTPESRGGWRALVAANETPNAEQKAAVGAKGDSPGTSWPRRSTTARASTARTVC